MGYKKQNKSENTGAALSPQAETAGDKSRGHMGKQPQKTS